MFAAPIFKRFNHNNAADINPSVFEFMSVKLTQIQTLRETPWPLMIALVTKRVHIF